MVPITWYMVHGVLMKRARCNLWKNQNGTWYMVHGTWYMVHGTWYMVHGVLMKIARCNPWENQDATYYMVHSTWYHIRIRYTPVQGNNYLYRNSALQLPETHLRNVIYLIEMRWHWRGGTAFIFCILFLFYFDAPHMRREHHTVSSCWTNPIYLPFELKLLSCRIEPPHDCTLAVVLLYCILPWRDFM
jgi:hypothetical protein